MGKGEAKVRIGFIGAGAICEQRHLPGLASIDSAEVVAVCNRSEASGNKIAERWGIGDVMTDWRGLVVRDDIDAVFIGTWPYMHAEMAAAVLDAGKHVFCQARMACNVEEARKMLEAADEHSELVNMICPPPHRMPYEAYVQKVLKEEELGTLREVRVVCRNASDVGPLNWRQRIEYSGQQIMQVGIWAEVLHAWVGEYRELEAMFEVPLAEKDDPETEKPYRIEIPQVVKVSGRLGCGVMVSEDHSAVAIGEDENHVTFIGSEGAMRVHVGGPVERATSEEAEYEKVDVPAEYVRDWEVESDFIEAIHMAREGVDTVNRRVSPDFAEGLKYMKKMDAVHRAARQGKVVVLQ
ncbi:Gfo/Idh/MocA family protein [Poriferisphaera sp. WC338]|uniref:Gfo/Idh/MocA family protein n=1 Tax=Poriferisphaera sp. WC338 TaxID=3425129 RepID=UPI003D819916